MANDGEAQRATDKQGDMSDTKGSQRSRVKGPGKKSTVSQAGAERLKCQESKGGDDWKQGEKIESDN